MENVKTKTYQEFRNSVIGKGFDMDGYYGYQCWDGVDLLYQLVADRRFRLGGQGYAYEAWANESARQENGQYPFELITNLREVKRGDIVILGQNIDVGGVAGHCAYADEDYKGLPSLNLLGQNQGIGANLVNGTPFNVTPVSMKNFLGAFRYKEWHRKARLYSSRKFPWLIAWKHWRNFKI